MWISTAGTESNNNIKSIGGSYETYLSLAADPEAGFKLRNAFNHLVFIDAVLATDSLRSPLGDRGSNLLENKSFCN